MEIPIISKWYNKLITKSNYSPETKLELASKSGVKLADDNETPFPLGVSALADETSFFKYWLTTYKDYNEERLSRYKTYDVMDSNSTEVSLMLDTYASESLSVGFIDHPLSIDIDNKEARAKVLSILNKAEFLENSLANIRSLVKYGDLFYRILTDDSTNELFIKKLTPDKVSAVSVPGLKGVLGFKINSSAKDLEARNNANLPSLPKKDHILNPWDVVQFSLFSDEFYPYGKSELERIRSAYDQLITMEALFAISRANRVERLVIKVPTNLSNPTSAFSKLQQLKAQIKSVVLGQGKTGRFSANKEWGLTDTLFMPADKDFGIEKLSSTIDISSDEDVRYFFEKLINGTRIPKGFLSGDEVTDRGNMLAQQDLRFSRTLIPIQQSYVNGVSKLCSVLLIILGYYEAKVSVTLEKPNQITKEQIANYDSQIISATNYLKAFIEMTETPEPAVANDEKGNPVQQLVQPKVSAELFVSTLIKFGVPKSIAMAAMTEPSTDATSTKVSSSDSVISEDISPEFKSYVISSFRDKKVSEKKKVKSKIVETTLM